MKVFGTDKLRGCYHNIDITTFESMGARIVLPTDQPAKFTDPTIKQDNILISSLSYTQKDKFSVVQCFADTNHVYAFGHDPVGSIIHVELLVFLVNKDGTGPADGLLRCLQAWSNNRLYRSLKPTQITVGGVVLTGYMVGNGTATQDKMINLQSASYDFIMTGSQGGNGNAGNEGAADGMDRGTSDVAGPWAVARGSGGSTAAGGGGGTGGAAGGGSGGTGITPLARGNTTGSIPQQGRSPVSANPAAGRGATGGTLPTKNRIPGSVGSGTPLLTSSRANIKFGANPRSLPIGSSRARAIGA